MKRWLRRLGLIAAIMALVFLMWFWLLPNDGNPRSVGQAVERLQNTLPSDVLESIAASKEEDLFKYHFSLGMHIRNEYGLWKGNLRLVISIGHLSALHPDSASGYIIHALWKELRQRDTSLKSKRNKTANKTDGGNGSNGICRVIDASRSPSPDPRRSANPTAPLANP